MQNTTIYRRRIEQFVQRVQELRYRERAPLEARYTYDRRKPIPMDGLAGRKWKAISPGTRWGELWGSAWFRLTGAVPESFAGEEVVALVDLGSEGCVFVDGTPWQGLTDVPRTGRRHGTGKRRVMIAKKARGGDPVDLLIEAGANALFGYHGHHEFVFAQAELAVFDREMWQLGIDLEFLFDLATSLPAESVRARRLLDGLNRAANAWANGAGAAEVRAICAALLKAKAVPSATTAWSVGHAHLDLGWLWPVRETRRKAGRTFATALRLLEEYPDYVFGSSQPQALAWVKEDYPKLYEQIRAAVAEGRWECQGAMWVEPDMNVPGGEALARQLLYGIRFFEEEFGKRVTNLWLPDVFGYSAALPQLLRLSGVDSFMTQKISWNESTTFPHHTFEWEGIDGTRVRTHFLPTNTYNAENTAQELIAAEHRFAQADVSDDWLNLYGIGDGGGGPSRKHVEFARRAANTEGIPRVKMAPAERFFARIANVPADRLPLWRGELYLELHRGTYTTQAAIKRLNRRLELTLRDAEYLATAAGVDQREPIERIWKNTLLNQFHDILPGSSIGEVYATAREESERNLEELGRLIDASLAKLHGRAPRNARAFVVHNTLSWERGALVPVPWTESSTPVVRDADGGPLVVQRVADGLLVPVSVPPMGWTSISMAGHDEAPGGATVDATASETPDLPREDSTPEAGRWSRARLTPVAGSETRLENAFVRVDLAGDGTIDSIYDKEHRREALADGANRLLLWEDLPYSWDAWDISHYYRETEPEQAVLTDRRLLESGPLRAVVEQVLTVGSSTVRQRIVLEAESRLVRVENRVDWRESRMQLRVQAVPAVLAAEASYEIQYGTVRRPAHANTLADAAKFEVAGQRFADLSQPDYGVGLVNDSKYGHYLRDGIMELTLLRSPRDPDPEADLGEHEFTFGYYPHAGTWEGSDLLERAHELNSPVLVRPASRAGAPVSEFDVAGGVVKLEAVKPAEDGGGVVLRLYETRGTDHDVVLRFRRPVASVEEVNLVEEAPRKLRGVRKAGADGYRSEVRLGFSPYRIRTLRVTYSS
ncbi:MAG: alpha-mannosidase [Spirochaetota bacterium]